ncbi:MAG: hypothetical protein BMS9Abin29_0076 [Gemmatimonadota bacterium]|nr:MAG: hypothetical protein BMS9Abin29_0076 [Gemmatimonadota bacterium]
MNLSRASVLGAIVIGAVAVAVLGSKYGYLTGLEELELLTLDRRQQFFSDELRAASEDNQIVLVLFDSTSVRDWPYLSPFPRRVLAELIRSLSAAGARTIGLDVYLDRTYEELNSREGGDDLLRDAIKAAGNVVLVAPTESTEGGPRLALPDPFFLDVAADVGAAELPTPHETVRDGVLAVRSAGTLEPSWSLALYANAQGLDVRAILRDAQREGRIDIPGLPPSIGRLPRSWTDGSEATSYALPFTIRFVGPPSRPGAAEERAFPAFSASVVSAVATFSPEFFRGKIVLMGTGFHESDRFRTPFYDLARNDVGEVHGWTYGVEVHANALQNLLDSQYIRPAGNAIVWTMLLVLAGVTAGIVFWRGAVWGAGGAVVGALGSFVLAFQQFGSSFLWLPIVAPLVVIVAAYLGSTAYVSIVEGRDKRFIKSAFGKFVSPSVVDEIAADPSKLKLGGQTQTISVLFSDLAGFTSLSEDLEAETLIVLLNEYLSEMTELVLAEEGYLDKYIGDAVMAFWNAPKAASDHADRALRCAIMMQRKLCEMNARWRAADPEARELRVRIGINTGEVVVGNVGGKDRFDYSAIGDSVNLGARLEPANKDYDTLVMTSEYTLNAATPENYRLRELDFMTVVGQQQPVKVYEVLELADGLLEPSKEEALRHYASGMAAYKNRDWELAEQYFKAGVEADPEDGPSKVYLDRAERCVADPPPADWDFVVHRTKK